MYIKSGINRCREITMLTFVKITISIVIVLIPTRIFIVIIIVFKFFIQKFALFVIIQKLTCSSVII